MIKTFKLNFDGTFDEIAYENIKDVFTIVNILAIYIQKIKTMYIWIGRNATQALKNHITQIRVLLKDEFPDFRIIRNITFDMRAEPLEFFINLNMKKEELYEIINYQEKTVLPILEKVESLKKKSENLIKSEQYKNAIKLLKEIKELAKKIQDDALETEQIKLISELAEKYQNKEIISEIEEETVKVEKEYDELVKSKKVLESHNLVENFIRKYETIHDLSSIPKVKEFILKEKRNWNLEQEKLRNNIIKLEKELIDSLEKYDLSKATEIFEKGLKIVSNLIDEQIKINWNRLQENIQDTKEKVGFIENFEKFSKHFITLRKEHKYNELKSEIKGLYKHLEKRNLPEYRSKLDLMKNEAESAEQSYNNINKKILKLEKKIKSNRKNGHLNEVVKDCDKLIPLAKALGKIEFAKIYIEILELTKRKIKEIKEFEEKQRKLKIELSNLEENFKISLKAMEIKKLNDILDNGSKLLSEIEDNEVKKKWNDYKSKFDFIKQLLENIEHLSKNAINALDSGSCLDSLEFFDQIIIQLKAYRN